MKWNKIKNYVSSLFKTNNSHHGSYSAVLSCIVIALAVIVNMAANALPSTVKNIDISGSQVYTLSDQTKKIVEGLEDDVTIYTLFEDNYTDDTLMQLLNRYKDLSDHIKVENVDPVSNPTFASNYDAESLQSGSVIVESSKRYKTISSSEIYETSYASDYSTTQSFDGEGEITSAIDYVTSSTLPVLYYTTGHDETTLSDTAETALTKSNYDMKSLSLLTEGSIPDDCGVLMILAPQSDFSSDEADLVIQYLENGGRALIFTSYTETKLTEFERILENYGMKTSDGIVFEGDSSSYYQSPMYIFPQYGSHDITSDALSSDTPALIIQASAIGQTDVRSSVSLTPLLTTSDSSYEKVPENGQFQTAEKEKNDTDGPFTLAMLAEETTSDDQNTQLVVFSTPYLVEESFVSRYNISNVDLLVNSIGYMCEHESSVTIEAKSMTTETITPSAAAVSFQALFFVILLPAVLLITGIVIWVKRRKK
ncbi:MAG: GldG family protein [Lachnospiraceae bacterium]|nr:GldG family protein [Lachnospiraceae bacterium]